MQQSVWQHFLEEHQLPLAYAHTIENYIRPIAEALAAKHKEDAEPLVIGINGCQGSGKTTLADALVILLQQEFDLNAVAIAIDDFYLTQTERKSLAKDVHPLLLSRGVPGTHDVHLAVDTLKTLTQNTKKVAIPRFDKSEDDRLPQAEWDTHQAPMDVVILEGWCVAALPQAEEDLVAPINDLEREQDPDGVWRRYVNAQLQLGYRELFAMLDARIMLQAPSFDCVFRWRLEQEEKLKQKTSGSAIMSAEELQVFIQHYQRLTEHTLATLPEDANYLWVLDEERNVVEFATPVALT